MVAWQLRSTRQGPWKHVRAMTVYSTSYKLGFYACPERSHRASNCECTVFMAFFNVYVSVCIGFSQSHGKLLPPLVHPTSLIVSCTFKYACIHRMEQYMYRTGRILAGAVLRNYGCAQSTTTQPSTSPATLQTTNSFKYRTWIGLPLYLPLRSASVGSAPSRDQPMPPSSRLPLTTGYTGA